MFSKNILVRFTVILMTCSSLGWAQQSESASTSVVGGQIVLSLKAGLKEPVLVLLDHSGSKNDERTFTDLRGNFEFRNVPQGSYYIRVRLRGFENVNYPVDVPGTPGEIYLEKNNFERAAEVLSHAIRIEPGSAIAHYALGRARYSLSKYAEAEQAFTRVSLLDKDFEAAQLMLLHVYVRQGKLNAALSGMDALLQKNPGSSSNPALEKFRSEIVVALAKLKQGARRQK